MQANPRLFVASLLVQLAFVPLLAHAQNAPPQGGSAVPGSAPAAWQRSQPAQPQNPSQTGAAKAPGSQAAAQPRGTGQPSPTTAVNSAGAKTNHANATAAQLPPVVPAGRPAIGVALEGGGALGLAHIGVLQWFEENHIPVDRVAGTSMGALIGGLYATGHSMDSMQRVATGDVFRSVFAVQTPYTDATFRRKQDRRELPQGITLGLKGGVDTRNSLLEDADLNAFLMQQFTASDRTQFSYNALPIPFRCVSTDLNTMLPVIFDGGPMAQAVRASLSIPGLFSPVEYHDHYLVDGGVLDNLPTDIARQDLRSDVVIAVHLQATQFTPGDVSSILSVFSRSFSAAIARNERDSEKLADVIVSVDLSKFSTGDYDKAAQLINAGHAAAEAQRTALLKYALDDAAWASYLADRQSRVPAHPGQLLDVKVEGGSAGAQAAVMAAVKPLQQKPIESATMTKAIARVEGNGGYRAAYETFSPPAAASQSATPDANTQAPPPDTGVLIHLNPSRNGPPFLLVGADVEAANSNVTRTTLDTRLVDQNLGGYGSELRADVRLGFLTQASTEYYRLLTASGYYLQPHVGMLRQPVYLWQNQQRISEHLEQQAGGGLDLGRTFNSNLQTAMQYRAQVVRWHPVDGNDGAPSYSGTAQTAVAHLVYDSTTASAFSTQGMRVEASAGALFRAVGSENAPLLKLDLAKGFQLGDKFETGLSLTANSYLKRNVAQPLLFSLGGPLRLSASSIDEYRGTDDVLVRTGVLRKISSLPFGLGEGLYGGITYEAGEIWSPITPTLLRQDGAVTAIGVTPLGVITIGAAAGDAGRRKIFFSYGRLF